MREASSLVLAARLQADGAQRQRLRPGRRAAGARADARARLRRARRSRRVAGADAVVLVTEWREFVELDWAQVAAGDERATLVIDGRNALDPEAVRAAGPDLRGHRTGGEPHPGGDPRGRAGHPPAPAHLDRPQAGRAARRPAVHRLHARVAARPRRRRRDHVVRLPRRQRARRAGRRLAARHPPALRRGARAAGHRRRAEARRADARRALPDAQRRRAHRHRPDARRSPSTSATGARATLALVPVADPSAYGAGGPRTRTAR